MLCLEGQLVEEDDEAIDEVAVVQATQVEVTTQAAQVIAPPDRSRCYRQGCKSSAIRTPCGICSTKIRG